MAKKKLILSQEQIKRICEGEDFVYLSDLASKPDMGDVYSTEITTDGSIEDEILKIVCRDDYEEKKDSLIGNNYTLAYHLSPIRENILNWAKEKIILEQLFFKIDF